MAANAKNGIYSCLVLLHFTVCNIGSTVICQQILVSSYVPDVCSIWSW